MMDFKMPDDGEVEQLREIFHKNSLVRELTASIAHRETSDELSPSRLYAYLTSFTGVDEKLELKVQENVNLRRLYREIVDQTARYRLPEAMAASSEEYPIRHGNGCTIRMEPSRAEPDQVYVIIEFTGDVDQVPRSMFVCAEDKTCTRFELPELKDGIVQFISDSQSNLIKLLMNPKTEAFLR